MTTVEHDVMTIPRVLAETYKVALERRPEWEDALNRPLALLGCGSSYFICVAGAYLFEAERGLAAQAILPSDYLPRPTWSHVAISRSGKTTELINSVQRARSTGAGVGLIVGDRYSEVEQLASVTLPLEFAAERGVVQTRFILAVTLALHVLFGCGTKSDLEAVPLLVEEGLSRFDPDPLTSFDRVVILGRGWRYGLALSAALTFQETALTYAHGHQTLDYRHGPIALADESTLVWCLDPEDDVEAARVLQDVRQTGATVVWNGAHPLTGLAQCQLVAARRAAELGIDSGSPRHLSREVILSPN